MTQMIPKGAAFWFLASGLTACATAPAYPISAAAAAPPPPAAAPTQAPAPVEGPGPASPAPSAPVESRPLGPVPVGPSTTPADARPDNASPVTEPRVRAVAPPPAAPTRYIATGKVVPAKGMFRRYQVRKGDHLDLIARDLETTRQILIEANHLKHPDALKPGQMLRVPIEKVYVAQAGDTVFAVAKRFDVTPADLADLNAIGETHRLKPGEQLALPSIFHDTGPVAAPAVRLVQRSGSFPHVVWNQAPGGYPPAVTPGQSLSDSQVASAGRGLFVWPVVGELLSTYGVKDVGRSNDGIDIKAPEGTPVLAAADGEVVYAGDQVPGFGNLVLIKHVDGWVTAYAHLEKVSVKMREMVTRRQSIGVVGMSGGVSEPQLHFEIRYAPNPTDKARPIDPQLVLPK